MRVPVANVVHFLLECTIYLPLLIFPVWVKKISATSCLSTWLGRMKDFDPLVLDMSEELTASFKLLVVRLLKLSKRFDYLILKYDHP